MCYWFGRRPFPSLQVESEHLDSLDPDWDARSIVLKIPKANQFTAASLLERLRDIKRSSFVHEAANVITFLDTPSEELVYDEHFFPRIDNPYRQPLESPDLSVNDLALGRCILCGSFFWIDEEITDGWDRFLPGDNTPENCMFTLIYSPLPHQPEVFSCDAPEDFCPFCMTGRGALAQCIGCLHYKIPREQELYAWDDPLVTESEAEERCAECVDELRQLRGNQRSHLQRDSDF